MYYTLTEECKCNFYTACSVYIRVSLHVVCCNNNDAAFVENRCWATALQELRKESAWGEQKLVWGRLISSKKIFFCLLRCLQCFEMWKIRTRLYTFHHLAIVRVCLDGEPLWNVGHQSFDIPASKTLKYWNVHTQFSRVCILRLLQVYIIVIRRQLRLR